MLSFKNLKRKGSYSDHGNGPATHPLQPRIPGEASSSKRMRVTSPLTMPSYDVTRNVSDELLLRIFSYVDETTLLAVAPVSRQFYRVASDPQLWRGHYYRRFILPRADRIPGLKLDTTKPEAAQGQDAELPASSEEASASLLKAAERGEPKKPFKPADPADKSGHPKDHVDWKQQYRLRHNWARGQCEVRQVQVSPINFALTPVLERRTLVKVVDGLAVTVDFEAGLRAWDLRTQQSIAQTTTETPDGIRLVPTALALDGARLAGGVLDIILGFNDGTFGIWRLSVAEGKLAVLYRQDKSYVGRLTSVAYSYPYALTAAELGFITLYTFESPAPEAEMVPSSSALRAFGLSTEEAEEKEKEEKEDADARDEDDVREGYLNDDEMATLLVGTQVDKSADLGDPSVLSSLKSDYSRQPLVLSLRRLKSSAVASIAYSFETVGGWSIGIQNFDIRPSGSSKPDVITSRVAYTLPEETGPLVTSTTYRPKCPTCINFPDSLLDDDESGPAKLCYSHPYLLATMHDNTLVLFVVTATDKSLAISNPVRLYGHTSGIADADITREGRAVSVSERGDEIRVWDVEGRQGATSVEVRPRPGQGADGAMDNGEFASLDTEHRRNWVGSDEQRVTVLRETSDGRESLVTYDFT